MVPARALVAVVFVVVGAACGGGGGGSAASTTTSAAGTTTAPAPSTTTTVAAGSTSAPPSTAPPYGSPCPAGSHPDCIDPDGDGGYELLRGGAECIKALGAESGLCSDLDGDGRAGYPDSG
ncbi:MAG: hypothetical protein ACLGI3_08775 [Actinomycetes bacterium]